VVLVAGRKRGGVERAHRRVLALMLREVLLGQLAQRDLRHASVAAMQPLERDLQRVNRLALTCEPAHLWPCRTTTVDAIAVCPGRFAICSSRPHLEHLSLLRHRRFLLALDSNNRVEESKGASTRRGSPALV
jgi:hypothetical protein